MIDSAELTLAMESQLSANQNTGRFGRTDPDGIWRDKRGRTVEQLDHEELNTPEAKKVADKAAKKGDV